MLNQIKNEYSKMDFIKNRFHDMGDSKEELYKFGVVYFGFDTFSQNEVFEIMEFLNRHGFNIIDYKIRSNLLKTEIENLFLPNNSCIQCSDFRWWMVQETIDLGALMVLIVNHGDATVEKTCLNRLNELKGYGDPIKAEKGTIREKYSAINYSMNMIHVPDDGIEFLKDTTPFYTVQELKEIFRKYNNCEEIGRNFLSQNDQFDIKSRMRNFNQKYSFYSSVTILKFRIIKSMENVSDYCDEILKFYREEYERLKDGEKTLLLEKYQTSKAKEYELYDNFLKNIESVLNIDICNLSSNSKKIRDLIRLQLLQKIVFNSTENMLNHWDFDNLYALNIELDKMDKHIILTSAPLWNSYNQVNYAYEQSN